MSAGGSAGATRKTHPSTTLRQRTTTKLGWRPDLPDIRDHIFKAPRGLRLPTSVDLRASGMLPPVWDQGQIGSCTGHGVGALVAYALKAKTGQDLQPSRLFIYYNERVIEGDVSQDNGAQIRDGIKSVATLGVPVETDWPYDVKAFARRPPAKAYSDGLENVALTYQRVERGRIRQALAAGHAVVFGFTVYDNFQSGTEQSKDHLTPMPTPHNKVEGGHCTLIVGYDDARQAFLIRNSWGADWCDAGHFWMPYAYISHRGLSSDFWTVTLVGKAAS